MYRIGIGYDLHRLVKRRKLILGGVLLPSRVGLLGHSDADVLAHAVCDALLGACAQKDIGEQFPASHSAYKNISSMELLKKVNLTLKKHRYSIRNIDSIVVAEKPNLIKYKARMCREIARSLGIGPGQVSVKAKTSEGVGPVGEGKAISAYAVALIKKRTGK